MVGFVLETFENIPRRLENDPNSCDNDRPEVETGVSLESDIHNDEQLNAHPVCHRTERGDEAVCCWARDTLVLEHTASAAINLLPREPSFACKSPIVLGEGHKFSSITSWIHHENAFAEV